ncbi:baeRF3 domain-containing protein [Oligoflexus tunisiensis]|uniref:baeRF3 domain-containing protein n=1 Tax=Oligoflexus tunisiensis TaxID=708132 RepID=UPI00114CA8D6|nr:hypothetical protein [Oligoflexus tunisiensis]
MRFLSVTDFHELMKTQEYPCISLYLDLESPTGLNHGIHPRLYAQLGHIRGSISRLCNREDRERLLQPLHAAARNLHAIPHEAKGLAMFRSFGMSGIFPTSLPVQDHVALSDSFHLKPILPMIQNQNIFYVITLTQTTMTLFSGDATGLKELKTYTMTDGEGGKLRSITARFSRNAARGRVSRYPVLSYQSPTRLNSFFQDAQTDMINRIQPSPGPVVTVGSTYLRRMFATNCKIPNLLKDGINFRYSQGNHAVLHRKALALVEDYFNSRALVLSNQYLALLAKGRASNNMEAIAESIFMGRVNHILIAKDRALYGRLDRGTGRVINLKQNIDPIGDDVLCDLAQEVILRGGNAHLIPQNMMPTPSPVAALYRW